MDILESLFRTSDQPQAALHMGEAYGVWFYYVLCSEAISFCQLTYNHAHDADLKRLIDDVAHELEKPQLQKLAAFMTQEGIPFPDVSFPKHPLVPADTIPQGARMADVEIANVQAFKLQALITTATANMQQALRDDVGAMYVALNGPLLATALRLKKLMQERGWLIVPPAFGHQIPSQ